MFRHLAEIHFELEHAAVKKMYSLAAELYYGRVQEDVDLLDSQCTVCLVKKKIVHSET